MAIQKHWRWLKGEGQEVRSKNPSIINRILIIPDIFHAQPYGRDLLDFTAILSFFSATSMSPKPLLETPKRGEKVFCSTYFFNVKTKLALSRTGQRQQSLQSVGRTSCSAIRKPA